MSGVYSHSKLSTFENCPQQFKLRYIDKVKLPDGEEEGIEAFLGSRVHEVLEKLHKELMLSKQNSLKDLLKYYDEIWKDNWHKNIVIVKKQFNKSHYKKAGKEAIENYYKRYSPFNHDKTLSTEQLVTFKIGDYTFRGFIDRLCKTKDGAFEIQDYKTSGTLPTQAKFDSDRQLALYQIGVKTMYREAKDVRLVWHYLLFDHRFESHRTTSQLNDLKKQIISLIKSIKKESKFKPNESHLCSWCEYPAFCPAKKHEYETYSLPKNKYMKNKGVALVNKYAEIKAEISDLETQAQRLYEELELIEEAAITYAKKNVLTNIANNDNILRISEKEQLKFPPSGDKQRQILEAYIFKTGLWERVSSLSLPKLSKLLNDNEISSKHVNKIMTFAHIISKIQVRLVNK